MAERKPRDSRLRLPYAIQLMEGGDSVSFYSSIDGEHAVVVSKPWSSRNTLPSVPPKVIHHDTLCVVPTGVVFRDYVEGEPILTRRLQENPDLARNFALRAVERYRRDLMELGGDLPPRPDERKMSKGPVIRAAVRTKESSEQIAERYETAMNLVFQLGSGSLGVGFREIDGEWITTLFWAWEKRDTVLEAPTCIGPRRRTPTAIVFRQGFESTPTLTDKLIEDPTLLRDLPTRAITSFISNNWLWDDPEWTLRALQY